jgi:hypothetical protein
VTLRPLGWLRAGWNRLTPDGKAASALAFLTLIVTIIFGLSSIDFGVPEASPVKDPPPATGDPAGSAGSAGTILNEVSAPEMPVASNNSFTTTASESETAPKPLRQCPSEVFADAQGDWHTKLSCDGKDYGGRLSMQFVSAKGVEATLTFDRAAEDEGEDRDPLHSRLFGEFDAEGKTLYLSNRRDPLRSGYPLVEIQFRDSGLAKDRLKGNVFDVESRRATCGAFSATREARSFGGRSYPQATFNRRRPVAPSFNPNDC